MYPQPDQITKDASAVLKKPCDVVAMTGYLHAVDEHGNYRLYEDHHFRSYIAIPPDTIQAHSPSMDQSKKGQSIVWLDASKTIVLSEEVPVRAYQPRPRGTAGPGEDIGLEYPR